MKGGFNKILRNIVAGSSDTEYEKRLTKATFHLDSKEPKEKHVIYLLESLNGEHKDEVSPIGALKFVLERHISNLDNWAITSKVFIILHRSLQNKRVNRKVIRDLKKNEHLLHPYQKKNPDNKYNVRMFMEISKQYSVYIKYYMNTCLKTEILTKPRKGFSEEVRKLNISEILKNYEYFEGLSTQIFDLFQHTNFCKQTRLFSNVIFMLLKDLMEIYRIYYTHITELLERFPSLAKRDAQKAFVMYQNFVNLTEAIKSKANKLIYIFNFPITLPDFYNPERGLIDTLRVVVTSAASSSASAGRETEEKMNQISTKLRSGMNREQFEQEEKKGEDLEAIADMYFDCNALDRIDENANAPAADAMVNDPAEEIKMDKDLGLFEMINAGDFATVQGSEQLVAADDGNNNGQKQSFNFDDYNQNQEQKATPGSQIVDDIFGDSGQKPEAAQQSTPGAQPASAQNDLLDIFGVDNGAKNGAAENQSDALNDIFSAGNQALAPKVNDMPGQDKYSQLNSFYQQDQAQSSANQFQTQQPGNSDPFSQLMGGQQNNNRGGSFASGQPAASGFQPMAQQPGGFQPMMGQPQMGAGGGMGMGMGMGMMTNQPQAAAPLGGMNPFAAFEAGPQQNSRSTMPAGGFGTAPPQQQQQQQQNQQNDPFNAFNF